MGESGMKKLTKRVAAAVLTLALAAAPVLSCCFGYAGHAHAAQTRAPSSTGHESGNTMRHHCAEAEGETVPAPAKDHDGACDGCSTCDAVQVKAQVTSTTSAVVSAGTDSAFNATAAHPRPDFMPLLVRVSAPPQGPPLTHRTPVHLYTTLRL